MVRLRAITVLLAILLSGCASASGSNWLWTTHSPQSSMNLDLEQRLITPEAQPLPYSDQKEVIGGGAFRYRIQGHETLLLLARTYDLGFNEIAMPNPGVDAWTPKKGAEVFLSMTHVLPSAMLGRADLVINLSEMRLFHRRKDGTLESYPVGIGREGFDTPVGFAKVTRKKSAPNWYVPASIRKENPKLPKVVPAGPNNPLGSHAVYLSMPGYLIHGTNKPYGIGRRVSHGCIRLYPEDIPRLYTNVQIGTRVAIVNEPVKAGWFGDNLLLEVFPAIPSKLRGKKGIKPPQRLDDAAGQAIRKALARRKGAQTRIDWDLVAQMMRNPDGVSRVVGRMTVDGDLNKLVPVRLMGPDS
uniref:L,D-TPase catalytic domain-containing protein n=1 Tax=Magnetococcus massalia (strain MO-1) TaxID=451514 RepID=A0A1S7LLX0_MAGMO|nr:Conserved protein of unknown function [Candidatus Magnetococcus massalia]